MKHISLLALSLVISAQASALTLKDLVGTYKVTTELAPIENIVSISKDGTVQLEEKSPYGLLKCEGKAKLSKGTLTSKVECQNGSSFTQKVNLTGVEDLNQFTAPVYSSLYDMELEMNFEKLK